MGRAQTTFVMAVIQAVCSADKGEPDYTINSNIFKIKMRNYYKRENFSHLISRVDFLDNVKTFLMEDFNSIKAEYWNTVPTQKCKKN